MGIWAPSSLTWTTGVPVSSHALSFYYTHWDEIDHFKPFQCLNASNGSPLLSEQNQAPDKEFQGLAASGPYSLACRLILTMRAFNCTALSAPQRVFTYTIPDTCNVPLHLFPLAKSSELIMSPKKLSLIPKLELVPLVQWLSRFFFYCDPRNEIHLTL